MTHALFAITALLASSAPAPIDQTGDAAVVAGFLAAIERGDQQAANSYLTTDAFVGDRRQTQRTGIGAFAAYARECRLKSISLVATATRLPVDATWSCPSPGEDRHASFWFDGDRIARIAWGPPLVVELPSPARPR